MTEFDTYVSRLREDDTLDTLGTLVWYSVPMTKFTPYTDFHSIVNDTAKQFNFETPPIVAKKVPPLPGDVFMRGCTAVQSSHQKTPTVDPEIYTNYLIRPVGSDGSTIFRQVVAESVDSEDHQLSLAIVANLRFNKATSQLRVDLLDMLHEQQVESIEAGINNYLVSKGAMLTPYSLRESIRKCLESPMQGVKVRPSGSVYYVPKSADTELEYLELVCEKLRDSPSTPSILHILPLVDDETQRDLVTRSAEEDCVATCSQLMEDILGARHPDQSLSSKQFAKFLDRFNAAKAKYDNYNQFLIPDMEFASESLATCKDLLQQATTNLRD